MVLAPLIPALQAPDIVLHHHLPLSTEIGSSLLALWHSKLTLLSMALELLHYLDDPDLPLAGLCHLSHFGYDSLTVTLGEHAVCHMICVLDHVITHLTCSYHYMVV